MKVAEVIPLYKGQNQDQVINYRPISLLMTISKLLKKIVYSRVYNFLEKNQLLYDPSLSFEVTILVNMQFLNWLEEYCSSSILRFG